MNHSAQPGPGVVRTESGGAWRRGDQWISNGGVCKVFRRRKMGHNVTLCQPKHEADIWNFSLFLHWDTLTTNPELLPAPACVIHKGRRKFVFSSIQRCCQNVQLWNLVLCVHFVQHSVLSDWWQKAPGWCVVTNKPLAAVYSFIYQRPWLLWPMCRVVCPSTKTSNNSFLSSS